MFTRIVYGSGKKSIVTNETFNVVDSIEFRISRVLFKRNFQSIELLEW